MAQSKNAPFCIVNTILMRSAECRIMTTSRLRRTPPKNYSAIFKRRVAPLNCFGQASASPSGFSTQNRVFDEDFNAYENEDNAAGKFGVRFVFAAEDITNL